MLSVAVFIFTLCICGGLATQSSAQTCNLYVSPNGSDSNNGTSTSSPWKTAQHAFNSVKAGQTVCFRAGTYPVHVSSGYNQILNNSGTSGSWITITNYPGEVAIIEGNTRVQAAYVKFVGTPATVLDSGLTFDGSTTTQPLDLIGVMYSHDIIFDGVEIRNARYHAGIYQYRGYKIHLTGSYIHDNGRPGYINTDQGIYWDATTGGGNLIANNLVEHNVSCGIQLYPSPSQVTVEENTVVNNGNYGMVLYGSQNKVVNNIFSHDSELASNKQLNIYAGNNHVVSSNIFWSTIAALRGLVNHTGQVVTHSIILDPLFAGPLTHNYQLLTGSPAIDAGNKSYTQAVNKEGLTRGSPPDLGAY
jgi:parallel beta-helix repeat protein